MSTGGYKLVKFSWVGGRSDTELERTNFVLTGIVDMILNSSSGWSLDSDWNMTSSSDYKEMKIISGSNGVNIIKFLKNANYKLAIGYASGSGLFRQEDVAIKEAAFATNKMGYYPNGLYYSVVDNSSNWSDDQTYGIILPISALRWSCFGLDVYHTYNNKRLNSSFIKENESNAVYSYYFLSKPDCLHFGLFEKSSKWNTGLLKGFLFGGLINLFAHSLDNKSLCSFNLFNGANFGIYAYSQINDPNNCNEKNAPSINTDTTIENFGLINQESNYINFKTYTNRNSIQINDYENNNYCGYQNQINGTSNPLVSICNTEQLDTTVCLTSITGGSRWCPIQIMLRSSDPSEYGIIPGDGFKGYLDTDFIRGVTVGVYSKGQSFGNDNEFIYIGGGIALGWDKNNTESLF